jgi:2-methylisocitrate lyase-like PEP mutase family enzyme
MTSDRCRVFRQLHESGCIVLPNPWDVGSARILEQFGFAALATTSSGFAWSLGRSDYGVSLEETLAHLRAIADAVRVPVTADFAGGFAVAPEGVATNVAAAIQTGIAGLSIEDRTGNPSDPLFTVPLAVQRVRAARQAIDESGTGVLLTARAEGLLVGRPSVNDAIERLVAYAEAGADCLYAPGLRTIADVKAVVNAVAPKPVNVLAGGFGTIAELASVGVRRISVGGALARAAWSGFLRAARKIAEEGSFAALADAVPTGEMNKMFS